MNKNNVMINLNANIINTNTPIQMKLLEYKKYINKKLSEFNKKNKKSSQNLYQNSIKNKSKLKNLSANYKKIYKNKRKNNNDINIRKISPYMNNIKLNFNSNKSINNNYTKKPKFKCNINIISGINNNSRSSSTNSKSSFNNIRNNTKNKNKKIGMTTLKNFVFTKK
jgi:hypothetical protein